MIADEEARRALNEILQGRTHSVGVFDLATGTTTTTVTKTNISANSVILTMAYSALASQADITRIVPAKNSFVVTHTNSANARTHRYLCQTGVVT